MYIAKYFHEFLYKRLLDINKDSSEKKHVKFSLKASEELISLLYALEHENKTFFYKLPVSEVWK